MLIILEGKNAAYSCNYEKLCVQVKKIFVYKCTPCYEE